jgi:hypothetical protein
MTPALHAAARAPWLATWRAAWWVTARLKAAQVAAEAGRPVCRVCLCTDDTACALETPEGAVIPCWWHEDDLCSGCAAEAA